MTYNLFGHNMGPSNIEGILVSIIIPAYNEEKRIGPTLKKVIDYLGDRSLSGEIIVVDDGSRDATSAEAGRVLGTGEGRRLIRLERNRGKGAAVKAGVFAAHGRYVIFTDADLSTPIETVDAALELLSAGRDVVIGSRTMKGSRITARQTRLRDRLGKVFNLLVRIFFIGKYRDTQCGFKGFRLSVARDLFSRLGTQGFAFDVEILWWSRELGYCIAEFPVTWRNSRPSRVSMIGSSLGMLLELVRFKKRIDRMRLDAWSLKRANRSPRR